MKYRQRLYFLLGMNLFYQNFAVASDALNEHSSSNQSARPYLNAHLQRIKSHMQKSLIVLDPEDYVKNKKQNHPLKAPVAHDNNTMNLDSDMAELIQIMQNIPVKKCVPCGIKRAGENLTQQTKNKNFKRQKL